MSPVADGLRRLSRPRFLLLITAVMLFTLDYGVIIPMDAMVIVALVSIPLVYTAIIWLIFALRKLSRAESGYRTSFQLAMGVAVMCLLEMLIFLIWQDAQEECSILYKLAGYLLVCLELSTTMRLLKEHGFKGEAVFGLIILIMFTAGYIVSPVKELIDLFDPEALNTPAAGAVRFILDINGVAADLLYFILLRIASRKLRDAV